MIQIRLQCTPPAHGCGKERQRGQYIHSVCSYTTEEKEEKELKEEKEEKEEKGSFCFSFSFTDTGKQTRWPPAVQPAPTWTPPWPTAGRAVRPQLVSSGQRQQCLLSGWLLSDGFVCHGNVVIKEMSLKLVVV